MASGATDPWPGIVRQLLQASAPPAPPPAPAPAPKQPKRPVVQNKRLAILRMHRGR